eukprot:scaffold25072_cov68-Cyclotella_meneghiniana.AAC.7
MPSAIPSVVVPVAFPDPVPSSASYLQPVSVVMGISLGAVPAGCAVVQPPVEPPNLCVGIRISARMSHLAPHSMGTGYYVPRGEPNVSLLEAILPSSSMSWPSYSSCVHYALRLLPPCLYH